MARPSKLSPEQWAEVERRHAAGEGVRSLAREFGVDESSVRAKVSPQTPQVRAVAHQLAAAQTALAALPVAQQYTAVSLAEKLRNISGGAIDTAEVGVKTMALLHRKAYDSALQIVDHTDQETIRGVAMLLKTGNEAGQPAFNLLAANKERIKAADDQAESQQQAVTSIGLIPMAARNG